MGTGNAFEALSQCWLHGRKIHTAVFTRLLPAKFEKFCIVVWHFFSIQDFFLHNPSCTTASVPLGRLLVSSYIN